LSSCLIQLLKREAKNASLEQRIQQLLLNNLSKSKKATEGRKLCTQNALRWGKQSTLLKIARLAGKAAATDSTDDTYTTEHK
jgi:hypothetical protein